jgi:hypothetical protein
MIGVRTIAGIPENLLIKSAVFPHAPSDGTMRK